MSEPVRQQVSFQATPEHLYDVLMDSAKHAAFTGNGEVVIDRTVGGAFSAHGGMVEGRNLDLVAGKRIVQAWRTANWDAGIYSVVRMDLEAEGTGTQLTLTHSGLPADQRDHIDGGWHKMYWEPLKAYLGS